MNNLNKRALFGLGQFFVAMVILLFVPAWSLNYWQAWVFLGAFFVPVIGITLYLMKYDSGLLEKRMSVGPTKEKEASQKVIQAIAALAFIMVFVLSATDYRLGWSFVPWWAALLGDGLVVLGLIIVFFVFKANSYASGVIEHSSEQKIVTTGPYAYVRHPMYFGAFIMLIGMPPALASWRGLLAVIPLVLVIIWRLLDEEKFLLKNLTGYTEYSQKVPYRLIPYVW